MAKSVMLGMCASCKEWSDFYGEESNQLELFSRPKVSWFSHCCNDKPIQQTLESIPLDDGEQAVIYDQEYPA